MNEAHRLRKRSFCCGAFKAKLTLTNRMYVCDKWGMIKGCDLNAAENFNRAGLA